MSQEFRLVHLSLRHLLAIPRKAASIAGLEMEDRKALGPEDVLGVPRNHCYTERPSGQAAPSSVWLLSSALS